MRQFLTYAAWASAAGLLIPVMAVLNGRLGRTLGHTAHAPVVLFAVGLLGACLVSLLTTGKLPHYRLLANARLEDCAGGLIVAAYIFSVTFLAPSFGVGNTILFVMTAQILAATAIDHLGLLGVDLRPVSISRLIGLVLTLLGLSITQL